MASSAWSDDILERFSKPLPDPPSTDVKEDPPVLSEPPPPYSRGHAHRPSTSSVGSTKSAAFLSTPVVNIEQLQSHLGLLNAFKQLRTRLMEHSAETLPEWIGRGDIMFRWEVLVQLAVERFQIWVERTSTRSEKLKLATAVPPVDVLMAWHAYMLNPRWYAEDCDRISLMNTFQNTYQDLLSLITRIGDISSYQPTEMDMQSWDDLTSTPYSVFDAFTTMTEHTLTCPHCLKTIFIPYHGDARNEGYFDRRLFYPCPQEDCKEFITRDKLAVAKLAKDLAGRGYLPGSLRTANSSRDTVSALRVRDVFVMHPRLINLFLLKDEAGIIQQIMRTSQGYVDDIKLLVEKTTKSISANQLERIFSAYTDDRPFSIDLVGAINRQCTFIDKMYGLGWLASEYFDDLADKQVLKHAQRRYYAFLELMRLHPKMFLVPTLDIDLVWHTHQLKGRMYGDECMHLVGRYVDHDDKVVDEVLSVSFDNTARLWQQYYEVPYTHCGCPLPGATIGERLFRLTKRLSSSNPSSSSGDPYDSPTLDLTPPLDRVDAQDATHPSDHNAYRPDVPVITSPSALEKLNRRRRRDEKAEMRATGMSEREVWERDRREGKGRYHAYPFLYPVPLFSEKEVKRVREENTMRSKDELRKRGGLSGGGDNDGGLTVTGYSTATGWDAGDHFPAH
ncbi:hypothetical protein EIP91_011805 [Steccherinum ochraceum]|uniref:Uncharacterized protein n=1 Tax=Steccherinum ochraceum TaxID=92696 RepID=A0A4R0RHV8_9APHY|nr:hypothetical protein EIP91_011805 [Steccherinum ochraceum]